MKKLKKYSKIVLIIIGIVAIGIWISLKSFSPNYNGEMVLENLSQNVTVHFDDVGVPHIYAQNQEDAYLALGYVHAQDRLWQMELTRRIAAGRLSEIFGDKLIKTDIFYKGLGIEEAAEHSINNLDKNSNFYRYTLAYLNGINQFIEKGPTPIEFILLGVEKENYTLDDVYNVFGFMAFSFAMAHKTDPLLQEIKDKLGSKYLEELNIPIYDDTTVIKVQDKPIIDAKLSKALDIINKNLPVSSFIGSNSWVLGSEKTKNGKVILANDPHIGFSQPSVWYQSHIKTPNYEMYGYNIALTPFALLGHNKDYAYGITMLENDDIDFYFEENNPNNLDEYKTKTGFKPYIKKEKVIKIKDQKDTIIKIKESQHGPLVNDLIETIDQERPMSMQWIYTKLENKILQVSYQISHAKSLNEFKTAASHLHAPGLNLMYGDAENNIAWLGAAKLYKYRDSLNTKTVLNGASGQDEIIEYLDFKENPKSINPNDNYVYSANNQPDTISGILYPGYYLPEDRAQRIVTLLNKKNDWTSDDVKKMMLDVTSNIVTKNIENIINELGVSKLSETEKETLEILKNWDGSYNKNKVAPTVYTRFIYEFLKNTFQDEMGNSFADFLDTRLVKSIISVQLEKKESVWWDNIGTDKIESKSEIINKSFEKTIEFLENQLGKDIQNWKWRKVTQVTHSHALSPANHLIKKIFDVGPFETNGGNEVINNQLYKLDSTGYYNVHGGPSTRRVIDFSNINNSVSILPTGQSGNIFSPYYKNQAEKYLNGQFIKTIIDKEEIKKLKNKLVLKKK